VNTFCQLFVLSDSSNHMFMFVCVQRIIMLIEKSKVLQKEIVAQGRVSLVSLLSAHCRVESVWFHC